MFFWITTTNIAEFRSRDLARDVKEGCEVGESQTGNCLAPSE